MRRVVESRAVLEDVLRRVQAAASPRDMLARVPSAVLEHLQGRPVHLLACGKASSLMLEASKALCVKPLRACATIVPEHAGRWRPEASCEFREWPCDHPFATSRNLDAAAAVLEFVRTVPSDHALLVLLSGGASAHLTLPTPGLSFESLVSYSRRLMQRGRSIRELNACRKKLEALKGGRLALASSAARTLVLVLSDVLGDPLDVISSGPFAPDASTLDEAVAVHRSCTHEGEFPEIDLALAAASSRPVLDASHACFARVRHHVVGNNRLVTQAACEALEGAGVRVRARLESREGDVRSLAAELTSLAAAPVESPEAWVMGGEPVVDVAKATGVGGPSQELALRVACAMAGEPGWAMLAYSTDGIDGPTDAAGAVVDGETVARARAKGLDAAALLEAHDSLRVLEAGGELIRTGPTGTNVNHLAVLVKTPHAATPREGRAPRYA
jgi:glycerate 2-kinase